jgi:hypothetical protein
MSAAALAPGRKTLPDPIDLGCSVRCGARLCIARPTPMHRSIRILAVTLKGTACTALAREQYDRARNEPLNRCLGHSPAH